MPWSLHSRVLLQKGSTGAEHISQSMLSLPAGWAFQCQAFRDKGRVRLRVVCLELDKFIGSGSDDTLAGDLAPVLSRQTQTAPSLKVVQVVGQSHCQTSSAAMILCDAHQVECSSIETAKASMMGTGGRSLSRTLLLVFLNSSRLSQYSSHKCVRLEMGR